MFVSLGKILWAGPATAGEGVSIISVKTQNLKLKADHLVNRWKVHRND